MRTVDQMPEPGAPTSTLAAPYWEKEESASEEVVEATARTLACG